MMLTARYPTLRLLLLLALLILADASRAQRSDVYVPDDLKPWQGWVLQGKEYRDCPFFFDRQPDNRDHFICAWPGLLELTVTAEGGRFTQAWTVYAAEQWVALPGDSDHWPEQVIANGQSISIASRNGTPAVRLAPGRYTIAGRFTWDERPRTLPVPPESGLFQVTVDGVRSAFPTLVSNAVWLGAQEAPKQERDAIEVQVYRLVTDDVPTRLTARFVVEVSGSVREELIGPALPADFVPIALHSALPARLEADGNLRLQVRPGTWPIELLARSAAVLNEVTLPEPASNLPSSEIWSYQSNDHLRVTVPEGLPPADPVQVSVPDEWQELPAFHVAPGETLSIVEQSRGRVANGNPLRLERRLWLDFDGTGFAFSDTLGGTMRGGWRLDMALPYRLLSASEDQENLLVTRGPEEGLTGVELRRTDVNLQALGRSETRGAAPVSGWQTRFDSVVTELNLPPGHKLVAAGGADSAAGAWMERWQLLDFFLVLIVTLATARLFGRQAGAVAFLALVLCWHENGAPHWLWLNLLAAVALVRVAPVGRLRRAAVIYRGLGFAAVVMVLVPFVANELRIGIYPQLEAQRSVEPIQYEMPAAAPAEDAARLEMKQVARPSPILEEITVTGARDSMNYARYAPNAIVQAGPGRPSWRWNTYTLRWNGPVDPEQTLNLTIMPRWLVTVMRFSLVLLLAAFAAVFAVEIFNLRWPRPPRTGTATPATLVPGVLIGTLLAGAQLLAPPAAKADTPPPEILQQLEQRLLEPPPCTPRCAEVPQASVVVGRDTMTIELVVHALEDVAVPLPGSLQGWRPESVQVDGTAIPEVYRRNSDTLWIRATEGRHRIALEGPLPPVDGLEVPFPATPRAVTVQADGWTVSGLRDRRLLAGALQLTRVRDEGSEVAAARWESSRFPQFARIERTIELDLDWRIRTRVFRVAPEQGALTLNVPLLEGESVLSPGISVTDGKVLVSMEPSAQVVEWESTLARTSPLVLQVAEDAPWKEVWRFGIGNIWHARFSGVPESEPRVAQGVRFAEFYPRGGETLTLDAARPAASPGTTLAFDKVSVMTEVGARSRNVDMVLEYRSTRGAQHIITLPPDAEVLAVDIDGRNEPLRARDGELNVPILPGVHTLHVRWQREADLALTESSPPVDLGAAAGNLSLGIDLPTDRWILGTSGPRLGPAVMYWSELAAMILFAFILGRIELTPLRTRHWLLLGLGFSTFSWPVLVLVATWLLGAGARRRWQMADARWWQFDLIQIVLAALTVVALLAIVASVPGGLLGTPDMHIVGNGSYGNHLRWFADQSDSLLPGASVLSLPLWMY
ncbi:MAG: hypothetical protein ACREQ8_16245, partial [Woeseiaceae bacterium]